MVLSEDEVLDGEVLWRAFKCSRPTFSSTFFTLYHHPFSPAVGRPPTLTIEALLRRYAAHSTFVKVLTRTTVIYIVVTPWFVKNYLLCTPSCTPQQPSHDWSFLSPSDVHLRSKLPFSLRFLPLEDSYLLPLSSSVARKNFCRIRVSQWRISCNPAVLYREIMACLLTLAQRYFTVVIFF